MDPSFNVFPISSGFVLSYVQGYYEQRSILKPNELSHAWGCEWRDICMMASSGEQLKGQDLELIWSNFS